MPFSIGGDVYESVEPERTRVLENCQGSVQLINECYGCATNLFRGVERVELRGSEEELLFFLNDPGVGRGPQVMLPNLLIQVFASDSRSPAGAMRVHFDR